MFLRDSRTTPAMVLKGPVCGRNFASDTADTGKCSLEPGQPLRAQSPVVSIHRPRSWTLSLGSSKTIVLTPLYLWQSVNEFQAAFRTQVSTDDSTLLFLRRWPSLGTWTISQLGLSTGSSRERDGPWEM